MSSRENGFASDRSSTLTSAERRSLVHQLTHDVLTDAAPEELEQFEASVAEYLDHPGQKIQGKSDEMLGSALDIIVPLTPYVVAAATAAVRFIASVLTDAAEEELKPVVARWVRRMFHRESVTEPTTPMPTGLANRVHDIAMSVCRDLGADQGDATVIADAIVGRLTTAAP